MTVVLISLAAQANLDPEELGPAIVHGAMRRARQRGGQAEVDDVLHYMLWTIAQEYVELYGAQLAQFHFKTMAEHAHPDLEALNG